MPGGDYASGPVVRMHRQRVWIWITEWIEQDEGNTSGMQFIPLDTCQTGEDKNGAPFTCLRSMLSIQDESGC